MLIRKENKIIIKRRKFESEIESDSGDGAKRIYNDSDWEIYRITTLPAALKYGKGTKWFLHDTIKSFKDEVDGCECYFCLNKHDSKKSYCIFRYPDGDLSIMDYKEDSLLIDHEIKDPYLRKTGDGNFNNLRSLPSSIPCNGFDLGKEIREYIYKNSSPLEDLLLGLASGDNDINRIKKCLGDIDNLNVVDRNGQSPLTCAIAAGSSLDIIKLLVDHGASVNYGRKTVATPLIYGIMTGNEKIVGYLLSKGADPNKGIEDSKGVYALRQYVGDSPLTMARKLKRSQKIINLLQEYGAVES